MVKVRQDQPVLEDGRINIAAWIDRVGSRHRLHKNERGLLLQACELAEQVEREAIANKNIWSEGSSSFRTGLEMAEILLDLNVDTESLIASVLYRAVREGKLPIDETERAFGAEVANLIRGVLRMAAIGTVQSNTENAVLGLSIHSQVENLRKMLVSIIDDVRLPLIKLAERTCAIRAVKNAPFEKQQRVAREVFDIYAPLAHRLGIGHIKWELEDLSFRYLEPDVYKEIARLLDGKRVDRQCFVDQVIGILRELLAEEGVQAEISGRAKHIYSIWRKMRQKDIGFSQVYDIRAVRILVDSVADCYKVLGLVHNKWRNIPNEFDDYIASPKDNGYRSLHTAVIGPERKVLEIQIRTHEMHSEAEFGVCAHWQYKGDKGINRSYEQKVEWLRQVLAWHEETGGDKTLIEELSADIDQDRVYVFTPEGHVIELPEGATPLDFAYHIHTEVGHRCRGARVNGKIVPLNHRLKTSDQVEILMGKHEIPSRDWLLPALGYTSTARARSKIQQWYRLQAREQNIADGRLIMDREFRRLALRDLDLEAIAEGLALSSVDDLYEKLGSSDLEIEQVLAAVQQLDPRLHKDAQLSLVLAERAASPVSVHGVVGVGNMPVEIASCCHPGVHDAIAGYIDQSTAFIHSQDCEQFLQLQNDYPERTIRVSWNEGYEEILTTEVVVQAYERRGLIRDISAMLDQEQINILELNSLTDKQKNTVDMHFRLEVAGLGRLSRVLSRLNRLPNVYLAERK